MNATPLQRLAATLSLAAPLLFAVPADGAETSFSFTNSWVGAEIPIPDGQPEGVVDVISVELAENLILTELRVTLSIAGTGGGGFNGDLYVTLTHGNGYSVLLNRVGRGDGLPWGYGDGGFDSVTFDDAAPADVHQYRLTLSGNHAVPLGGPLTGTWQPDGRTTDPDLVSSDDPRTANLSSFLGESPNGEWTLFMADLSPGGESQLVSWQVDFAAIPEPSTAALGLMGTAALLALRRQRRG